MKILSRTLPTILMSALLGTLIAAPQARATEITGAITFAGGVKFDTTSLATATKVKTWTNVKVVSDDGDFGGIAVNTPAAMSAPWIFAPSTPRPGLWSVGGFTFDLLSSTVVLQNSGFLLITGVGIISGNGFDPTDGIWSFSTQAPRSNGIFSFSSSSEAVPDGGMTLVLLGAALGGLELMRRKVRTA